MNTASHTLSPISQLLPVNKEWYTAKEAASVIGRSPQYVRDCFDNQKLLGHAMNAKGKCGKEQRRSYQIPRASLMLYLMETANYQSGDYANRIYELLDRLSVAEKRSIAQKLKESTKSIWLGTGNSF